MTAATINYPAVRALTRLWAPIEQAFAAGEEAAYGFAAGEFSGPAMCEERDEALSVLAAEVAPRFGLSRVDLLAQANEYWHQQAACSDPGPWVRRECERMP